MSLILGLWGRASRGCRPGPDRETSVRVIRRFVMTLERLGAARGRLSR